MAGEQAPDIDPQTVEEIVAPPSRRTEFRFFERGRHGAARPGGRVRIVDSDGHEVGFRPEPQAVGALRPMTASVDRLDLRKAQKNQTQLRAVDAWQEAAWRYYDQIGEIKFAFGLVGQVVSRIKVYPAYAPNLDDIPMPCSEIRRDFQSLIDAKVIDDEDGLLEGCRVAEETMQKLLPSGYQGQFMQSAALNFSVPGECYILWNPARNRFQVASISEVRAGNKKGEYLLTQTRDGKIKIPLPQGNYIARVWRSHARYWGEPDSSMQGVLDACEQMVLVDQAIRSIIRSRMSAGVIKIPVGMSGPDGRSVQEVLAAATMEPVEDESSAWQVVPLTIEGDIEALKGLERIDLSRPLSEELLAAGERALERVLRGIDVPKDIVQGLADIKFSNGLIIDDNLYRAHIEPLVMLICDSLNEAYYQPALRKAGVPEHLIDKFVLWYDPSAVITRPDKSQAANEGHDRLLLSDAAWRQARGFSEQAAPDEDEVIRRLARDKSQVPPEMAPQLFEALAPKFFAKARQAGREQAGVPPEVSEILDGEAPAQEAPAGAEPSPIESANSGGEISPGGNMPPPVQ